MLELREMNEIEYRAFIGRSAERQAEDRAWANGSGKEIELRRLQAMIPFLLPEGEKTPGHFFRNVFLDGRSESVGSVWCGSVPGIPGSAIVLLDVIIEEKHRGKGYGREALMMMFDQIKGRNYTDILLNVRSDNMYAIRLYKSLGFTCEREDSGERELEMKKALL